MRQALTGKFFENFRTECGLTAELSAQSAQARKSILSVLEVFKPRFGPFWPFPLQFLAIFSDFQPNLLTSPQGRELNESLPLPGSGAKC